MATITNIKGQMMGFGQISHDPHSYFVGVGGALLLGVTSGEPDVTIETDGGFTVCAYLVLGKYLIRVRSCDLTIDCDKTYRNTASADCLVAAAEIERERVRLEYTGECRTKLEALRRSNGYTQGKLADIAGIHISIIGRIERGERDIMHHDVGTVAKIARALECSIEDLIRV